MVKTEINPKIAHRITEPLPGVTYSFSPDGRVTVEDTGMEHMYFSRTRRVGRDVGYMELRGAELYEYQARFRKIVLRAAA
jgi:hypothetical protein